MLTKQRQVIERVLKRASRPLTRKEILQFGREELPKLGSATVDRSINTMTKNFQLVGVSFPGQPTRYELPSGQEHPHFICRTCNQVYDLDIPMQLPKVKLPKGFHMTGGEVVYSGVCPKC